MRAIVLDRPGRFRVAKVPDPTPGPGQIVVKVDCCGICGTDIHIMDGEFPPTPYPITPGHEFAGTVAAIGRDVRIDLPVGTKVAVDPSLYCGYCRRCRSGRDNLCENWAAIGDTVDGAFAEYVAVPAANAHLLPDGIDGQLGAMIEPLACAVHGLRRLGGVFGDTVVLTGAGTMGLLLLQLLVHAGAGPVTVVDRVPDRLEVARKLGVSAPSLSHHFRVLKLAGLVRSERRGTSIVYTLQTNVLEGSGTQQQLFQRVKSTGADLVISFAFK